MIPAVAWRNIWRNRTRSLVVIIAITTGIFSGVFVWAFYRGMVAQRVRSAIITESSHIQLHHGEYLSNPDQKFYLSGCDSLKNIIMHLQGVKAVSERVLVNAMASSAENGAGVKVIGIDPGIETEVTNIYTKITDGTYLEGENTPILIGEKLAEKLSVKLRSRIVITLQTMDGTLTSGLFRVDGIYRTSNTMYDEANVFVRNTDLSSLMEADSTACHEIAVLLNNNDLLTAVSDALKSALPGTDVKTWRELMPEVTLIEESMDLSMYFFMLIVLAALIFGIINTMLMAVLERTKELGMLMAVGMNKIRVFTMILFETVLLSVTGGLTGIILAYGIVLFTYHKGIDLSFIAEGIEKLGYESIIYPVPDIDITLKVALMVLLTGLLAAIYPALKAVRLKPAEALHMDN